MIISIYPEWAPSKQMSWIKMQNHQTYCSWCHANSKTTFSIASGHIYSQETADAPKTVFCRRKISINPEHRYWGIEI